MKEVKAYFTVEASLVLPLVISALMMTFFSFVYQYNRCLMEQETGMLTLYAETLKIQETEDWKDSVNRRAAERNKNTYLFWNHGKLNINLKSNVVEITCEGEFMVPLPEWNLMEDGWEWKAETKRRLTKLSPAEFVRLCYRTERSK